MSESTATCYVGNEPATTSCTSCGKAICDDHLRLGQPFISLGELTRTAVRTPALLLGPPLAEVPYCPDCREDVAARRTSEQMKFLVLLLVLLVAIGGAVYLIIT